MLLMINRNSMLLGYVLITFVLASFGFSQKVIEPSNDAQVNIKFVSGNNQVKVINDKSLYLSVQVTELGAGKEIVVPHASVFWGASASPTLIGPQGGLFTAYSSNEVILVKPNGENGVVEIITPGFSNYHYLGARGESVRDQLLIRSFVDQFVLPILTALSGTNFGSNKLKYQLLQNALSEALAQNHSMLSDLKKALRQGDKSAAAKTMWNVLYRDIEAGGPMYNAIWSIWKVNIKKKIAEYAALRMATKWIPFVNAVDVMFTIWNLGPTGIGVANFLTDMIDTPASYKYSVYYKPGASRVTPDSIRTDRGDKKLEVHGYRLNDKNFPHRFSLLTSDGRSVFVSTSGTTNKDGSKLSFTVNGSLLSSTRGQLKAQITLGTDKIVFPDPIQLINVLNLTSVSPTAGRPGQIIRVDGKGLYPYKSFNKALFVAGSSEIAGRIIVAGEKGFDIEVPDLPEGIKNWKIRVDETINTKKKSSNSLPFERLPKSHKEHLTDEANAWQPELTFDLKGRLTDAKPTGLHVFSVPAGMEVVANLTSVDGPASDPASGSLSEIGLWIVKERRGQRNVRSKADVQTHEIKYAAMAKPMRHTTTGSRGAHSYYVVVKKGNGTEVNYTAKVKLKRKGDAGALTDAGDRYTHPMRLPIGVEFEGNLYGSPRVWHEDIYDYFIVPSIPRVQSFKLTVNQITADDTPTAELSEVAIYAKKAGVWRRVARAQNLNARNNSAVLEQNDTETRDVLIMVKHGTGRVRYKIRADIDFSKIGGEVLDREPIRSTFNEGTDEDWKVAGNYRSSLKEPFLMKNVAGRSSFIRSGDPIGDKIGPLDIVFVIDTTGSMKGAIQNVSSSARLIAEELQMRSTSLRVGLVGYKDFQYDGGATINSVDFSTFAQLQVEKIGTWKATGGGSDAPEDVLFGIDSALKLRWREKTSDGNPVAKVIVLMGDQPAKLKAGRDFAGRSIESVGLAAKNQGVRIYPVTIGTESVWFSQAYALAGLSGGRSSRITDPRAAANAITGLVESAMEEGSPRYFVAPAKFRGDMSRFFGRLLTFELSGEINNLRINSPDVILESGPTKIYSNFLGVGDERLGFEKVALRLNAKSNWYDLSTGRRIDEATLKSVLSNLTGLRIRSEYYSGNDYSDLDNVVLGATGVATDRGLTPAAVEFIESLWTLKNIMTRTRKAIKDRYGNPSGILLNAYNKEGGIRNASLAAYTDGGRITRIAFLGYPDSPFSLLFDPEIETIEKNILAVRKKGDITSTENASLNRGIDKWLERQDQFNSALDETVKLLTQKARANSDFFDIRVPLAQKLELRRKLQELDRQLDGKQQEMKSFAITPVLPLIK